jgi:hypothetical protein
MIKVDEAEEEMVSYCGANIAILEGWTYTYDLAMNGVRGILDLDFAWHSATGDVMLRHERQG